MQFNQVIRAKLIRALKCNVKKNGLAARFRGPHDCYEVRTISVQIPPRFAKSTVISTDILIQYFKPSNSAETRKTVFIASFYWLVYREYFPPPTAFRRSSQQKAGSFRQCVLELISSLKRSSFLDRPELVLKRFDRNP